MTSKILISGGTIINEGQKFVGYILIDDQRITQIGEGEYPFDHPTETYLESKVRRCCADRSFEGADSTDSTEKREGAAGARFSFEIIDARGKIVLPGVIDAHVHFREPGLTEKGDMLSESAAAVAGGVTSVIEMPNTRPPATSLDELDRKYKLAYSHGVYTNFEFPLGVTNDNLPEIKKFNFSGGQIVKLFNGSSTGNMLVDDPHTMSALFAEFGGIIAAHCEDETIISSNTEFYRKQLGNRATAAVHPLIRSAEACYVATARAVELADKYGTRLHVCHVSTERELSLFQQGRVAEKHITAEACIPHLWFSDEDYARLGNLIKCNPAIKTAQDRESLRNALTINKLDLIATDHAPHTLAEKQRPYWDAPSGIPMVQHSLPAMLELVSQGVMTLEELVEKMCHAPAIRFGIKERGFLRTGYKADIVIVEPVAKCAKDENAENEKVGPGNILYKCGWSPLEGTKFGSKVTLTLVNGQVAYDAQNGVASDVNGQKLKF